LLKARVQEELSSLLNATNFESVEELSAYPAVMETSLNYGIRDLTGRTRSGISASELERGVEEAIVRFEPRIIRETLKVSCSTFATSTGRTSLEIRIEGDLRCRPLPEALRLRTLLNLEDGEAVIEQE
jgi:type VI secretion system protein ImpF